VDAFGKVRREDFNSKKAEATRGKSMHFDKESKRERGEKSGGGEARSHVTPGEENPH